MITNTLPGGGDCEEIVQRFFNELEDASSLYEELTDTDVREAIHLTLNYYFVWAKPIDRLPCSYRMFTRDGDRAVAAAIQRFLSDTRNSATVARIPPGPLRLGLLQDRSVRTVGGSEYDLFIGHVDDPFEPEPSPEDLFEPGDYQFEL